MNVVHREIRSLWKDLCSITFRTVTAETELLNDGFKRTDAIYSRNTANPTIRVPKKAANPKIASL
jgi:hypothetical protein